MGTIFIGKLGSFRQKQNLRKGFVIYELPGELSTVHESIIPNTV